MRRPAALLLSGTLVLFAACGSGSKSSDSSGPRQPTDPRTVPTVTVPAVLPSPIAAGTVTGINAGGNATTTPTVYTVKSGDTLAAIASQLGVPLTTLQSYNSDLNPSSLKIGQEIKIPPPAATPTVSASSTAGAGRTATAGASATATGTRTSTPGSGTATATPSSTASAGGGQTYTVQSGDTGCKLAGNFQVSLQELAEANGTNPAGLASLKVGQQIKVPPPTGSPRGC